MLRVRPLSLAYAPVVLAVACSRPNPAYGPFAEGSSQGTDTSGGSTGTGADDGSTSAPSTGDGSGDGSSGLPDQATVCGVPLGELRFDDPRASSLNTANGESDPWVTADGQWLYFARAGDGGRESLRARWSDDAMDFIDPEPNPDLVEAPPGDEGKITYRVDEATRAVVAASYGGMGTQLWLLQRAGVREAFGPPAPLSPMLGSPPPHYDPHLSFDGRRLYFSGPSTNGGSQRLYVAPWVEAAQAFGDASPVPGVNLDTAADADPTLTADERVIVFTSTRGAVELDTDLWIATRDSPEDAFDEPIRVPDLNGTSADGHAHISGDGCRIWWSSLRDGNADLYGSVVVP